MPQTAGINEKNVHKHHHYEKHIDIPNCVFGFIKKV